MDEKTINEIREKLAPDMNADDFKELITSAFDVGCADIKDAIESPQADFVIGTTDISDKLNGLPSGTVMNQICSDRSTQSR
jgi:hypothetical protein